MNLRDEILGVYSLQHNKQTDRILSQPLNEPNQARNLFLNWL